MFENNIALIDVYILKCLCFQSRCNEVADKYIEYDTVIIFLDVLLLQRPAYRHILINSEFKVSASASTVRVHVCVCTCIHINYNI